MYTFYPREIRDVAPGPGFRRIESMRTDGLPDGVHTGGCWTDGKEVWKPLDGGNAHDGLHVATDEAGCLEAMAGEPGFPRNWRVEEAGSVIQPLPLHLLGLCKQEQDPATFMGNGTACYTRRWLVRDVAMIAGRDELPFRRMDAEAADLAETALRRLNEKGWELGDALEIAYDTTLYEWFVLDLSCASPFAGWNDEWRLWNWLELAGFDRRANLRKAGRSVMSGLAPLSEGLPRERRHVYASRNRPLSTTWCRIENTTFLPADYATTGVHSWAVADGFLPEDVTYRYELELAWWPWPGRWG